MQARSEETRMNILSVAQGLFAQKGYEATGIMDICDAAGVSKGAFYHHFPSKQAIFMALLEDWLAQLDVLMQAVMAAAPNVPEGLVEMAGLTSSVFEAADTQFPLFLEFWIQAGRQPEIWQTVVAPYHRYQALFSSIFDKGIQEESLNQEISSAAAARVIIALAMGLLLQALFDPDGANWSQVTQEGVRMLMDGLIRRQV
ncbi:MAG: TetR/AcrR family transcriptional regulator [Anaerolineales bacterium]|jgi:AcrR family transcriptional regulator|nr:TetR/AcrR family transcriptional regulator [Anaerolineales bacterium]